jgi:hypothetical protein
MTFYASSVRFESPGRGPQAFRCTHNGNAHAGGGQGCPAPGFLAAGQAETMMRWDNKKEKKRGGPCNERHQAKKEKRCVTSPLHQVEKKMYNMNSGGAGGRKGVGLSPSHGMYAFWRTTHV